VAKLNTVAIDNEDIPDTIKAGYHPPETDGNGLPYQGLDSFFEEQRGANEST
jgi:hypothetical protein